MPPQDGLQASLWNIAFTNDRCGRVQITIDVTAHPENGPGLYKKAGCVLSEAANQSTSKSS